jgi:hypothetical protein
MNNLRILIEEKEIKNEKLLELNQKLNEISIQVQNKLKGHYFI